MQYWFATSTEEFEPSVMLEQAKAADRAGFDALATYLEDIADQHDIQGRADEQMTDEQFAKEGFLIGSDPEEHIERIREMERAGATVVCLQLIGRADPLGSIRTYGEHVLPALRGTQVGAR